MIKHFTALADLPVATIVSLLNRSHYFSQAPLPSLSEILRHKVIANVFYEPSTRTRISFEMAAKRLGAQVINFDHSNSSVKKGETLYDTLRTIESIGADALILRHSDDRIFETLMPRLHTPLINAGAGKHEHPSQCLLDLLTLQQEFQSLEGRHILIVGDIRHSRVAGSMILTAPRLGMRVSLAGPAELLPAPFPASCSTGPIEELLPKVDAVMCLRNQFERHVGLELGPEEFHRDWGLTPERLKLMPKHAIIMHPAPINRGVEISDELVEHPASRIFTQMRNGVFARMSVLEWAMKGENP